MIEVGLDYSKDRKNDYTAETDDGYVDGCMLNLKRIFHSTGSGFSYFVSCGT